MLPVEPARTTGKCPDCGGVISLRASACPHCGLAMTRKHGVFYHVVAVVGSLGILAAIAFGGFLMIIGVSSVVGRSPADVRIGNWAVEKPVNSDGTIVADFRFSLTNSSSGSATGDVWLYGLDEEQHVVYDGSFRVTVIGTTDRTFKLWLEPWEWAKVRTWQVKWEAL